MADQKEMSGAITEEEMIAEIRKRFARVPAGILGVGDDAAIVTLNGPLVTSVDAMIEGVHFRREFAPLEVLAGRALEAAASDLAAMGAKFTAALLSFELPPSIMRQEFDAILRGFGNAAEQHGASIVGGNLARGARLAFHTTVLGEASGKPLLRSSLNEGDGLYLSGPSGAASLGLRLLLEGRAEAAPGLVDAFLRPRARFDIGSALVGRASAAIDLSDGLLLDLTRMLKEPGLGASVHTEALPAHPDEVKLGLGADELMEARVSGGESYELLVAGDPKQLDAMPGLSRIGEIKRGSGVTLVGADERPIDYQGPAGFLHF